MPRSGADRSLDTPVLDKEAFFLETFTGICKHHMEYALQSYLSICYFTQHVGESNISHNYAINILKSSSASSEDYLCKQFGPRSKIIFANSLDPDHLNL